MKPDFHLLFETAELPSLGPETRPSRKPVAEVDKLLDGLFASAKSSPREKELVRALALLWHDHLDEAHEIAQQIDDPDGSLLHAIMHRREPDFGNAKYWFHRVGRHAVFPEIARRIADLPDSESEKALVKQLCPSGTWDPFAYVDACQQARGRRAETSEILRRIQSTEFHAILDHLTEFGQD